jgi:type I restriction enzyme S subunit
LRGFGKSLDARFLFYGINKFLKEIEDVTGYTTVKHLSSKSILAIEMPVPPLNEQKRLVALLDAATARVTELTACYEQARTHANNLFTSALSSALEGNPDWPVKTLGEVCDLVGGGTPSKDRPDFYGGDIPWATVRDLNVEVLRSTEHSITAEALTSSSSNVIPKGSVVIATRVGLGKAVIVAQDTAINQDLRGLVVKNPKELLADYLFWWYLSTVHLVVAAGTGATVQGVKLPFVSGLVIPVPTLEEQKRIVARLDLMKAKTSEMVAAYDAKLTAAKNLRQSILEAAFGGDL